MARIAILPAVRFSRTKKGQAGFTLVEMLVVVTILALAASLFATGRTASGGLAELKAAAAMGALRLREARSRAVLQQRDVTVTFDLSGRRMFSADRNGSGRNESVTFGKAFHMQVFADAGERRAADKFGLRFRPDGSSSGATVRLTHKGRGYEIRVHWLTGRVSVAPIG